jgi:ribonuclease J
MVEDENGVVAVPVSHSSYPAYAFLYRGGDATVFYSGDLRFEPLTGLNRRLDRVVEGLNVDEVDVALLEGTNFGSGQAPVTPSTFSELLSLLFKEYELVAVSIDPLDLEMFTATVNLSKLYGRSLVVGSRRLLWAIEELEKIAPWMLEGLYVIEERDIQLPFQAELISLADEVLKRPGDYVLAIDPVGLLQILRKLKAWEESVDLAGSAVVLTDPEPLKAWFKAFGVHSFRLRLSGHYLPHHFRHIVETLKPRDLIPIHTEEARLMDKLFKKIQPSPHP